VFDKSKLHVGDTAPLFKRKDINGNEVDLSKFKKSYVLVAFLRYAGCPWCNLAIHRLTMEESLLHDNRCDVITFIQSTEENIETGIIERHQVLPKFPIVADQKMEVYKKYHVEPSLLMGLKHQITNIPAWVQAVYKEGFKQQSIDGELFLAPATFLISTADRKIIRADYDSDLYDHESFTKIYDTIAEHELHG
jgi:peroxiredoxin Q/BCP